MTSKTKILFIDTGPWLGGAQKSFLSLIEHLDEELFEITVLGAETKYNSLIKQVRHFKHIRCYSYPFKHWSASAKGVLQLAQDMSNLKQTFPDELKKKNFDIIHANGIRSALLAKFCFNKSIKKILHVRDLRSSQVIFRSIANSMDKIIAISEVVEEYCKLSGYVGKLVRIYNGIEIQFSSPETSQKIREKYKIGKTFTLCLIADMENWKRHDLFIEALLDLKTDCEFKAFIIGRVHSATGKTYLESLQKQAAPLKDSVEFITDTDNATEILQETDMLVSCASKEPFGRSVVEALGYGKPVIVCQGGGPEEIAKDCLAATIVESHPVVIADAIRDMSLECGKNGLKMAAQLRSQQFTIEEHIEKIQAVYSELKVQ